MATVQLGEWENSAIRATLVYDDVTFLISSVTLSNQAAQRCRFRAWRGDNESVSWQVQVNAGQVRALSATPAMAYRYEPTEHGEDSPALSNINFRCEYPA